MSKKKHPPGKSFREIEKYRKQVKGRTISSETSKDDSLQGHDFLLDQYSGLNELICK